LTALPWEDEGWLDGAVAWIDMRVERTGEVEVLKLRPWSAVIRVPTAVGDAWFKEAAPVLAFEVPLTELLAARRPEHTQKVIAAEGPRLLTADLGPSVRTLLADGGPALSWDDVVRVYAEVQIELAGDIDELLELGVPDSRPETLGHPVPGPVPVTLVHEEVTAGNVHVRDGRPVFIDWAEASVSHPFAGLMNTLRDVASQSGWEPGGPEVLRLRDVYLEPWTEYAPLGELREIFADGYALGALARKRTWERIHAPLTSRDDDEWAGRAAAWGEIYAEACRPEARLGA
jgi:Phosphotransferase enzyme family